MHEAPASKSGEPALDRGRQGFIVHQLSKFDNLAGLAIRYNVSVADIKRANGLLSDSGMFAKDTLLIPTQALPVGLSFTLQDRRGQLKFLKRFQATGECTQLLELLVECATLAGMIVTQYGRVGVASGNGRHPGSCFGNLPPSATAALDQLQQYYGIADTASEPGDFKPGHARSESDAGDVELMPLDTHTPATAAASEGSVPFDKRLRRRKADESPSRFGSSSSLAGASDDEPAAPLLPPGPSPGRPPLPAHQRSGTPPPPPLAATAAGSSVGPLRGSAPGLMSSSRGPGPPAGSRKESFLDKIKRAASQPALAGPPHQPSLAKMGDAAIASLSLPQQAAGENGGSAVQKVASVVQLRREKDLTKKA